MILSLETATRQTCSIALHNSENGSVLAVRNKYQVDNHLVVISNFIDELFSSNNFHYTDIKAIAVSAGPGSYTGLRIGVSMAKSLCYALSLPLIPVNTLYAMAHLKMTSLNLSDRDNTLICPLLDARRNEVYAAVYNLAGIEVIPPQAHILHSESFSSLLEKHPVIFVGEGVKKIRTILKHVHAIFDESILPQAQIIGLIAHQYYQKRIFADTAYFEPYYLKDFVGNKSV